MACSVSQLPNFRSKLPTISGRGETEQLSAFLKYLGPWRICVRNAFTLKQPLMERNVAHTGSNLLLDSVALPKRALGQCRRP